LPSPTANNIKKNFKLRLPNKTTKRKLQNFSIDFLQNEDIRPKQDSSKLSITQRLKRIELLEKEDKLYTFH
jgi:hypothetical protein